MAGDGDVFIGSIDQGTTSTRFLIFDKAGNPVASHQIEFEQFYEHPGYVAIFLLFCPGCGLGLAASSSPRFAQGTLAIYGITSALVRIWSLLCKKSNSNHYP